MKKILIPVLLTIITACSKSDAPSTSQQNDNSTTVSSALHFSLTYDGQQKNVTSIQALKQDDFIEVMGRDMQSGVGIDFKFNKYGNLFQAATIPTSLNNGIESMRTLYNFNANTFTFKLVEINESEKTVSVSYSGKVYKDFVDPQSNSKVVSGTFKVKYTDITPTISGLGTSAKLNDNLWRGMSFSNSSNSTTTAINVKNESEYTIELIYPRFNPVTGTYNFTNNDANKRIGFIKYDPVTNTDVEYNVSGTITYSTANAVYVQGTFSGVATHPTNGSRITITNGVFKEASR